MKNESSVSLPPAFQQLMRWEELALVDPRTLDDNPLNWREHPPSQLEAVLASIKQAGWVMPLLYNLTTGKLIDGHGRKDKAIKAHLPAIPVAKGRWTQEEEIFLLQNFDAIGSMFRANSEKLANLNALAARGKEFLKKASKDTKAVLAKLQSRMDALPEAINTGRISATPLSLTSLSQGKVVQPQEQEDEGEEESEFNPNFIDHAQVNPRIELLNDQMVFPSSNPWGIPDLDPGFLANVDMAPQLTYSRVPESVTERSYYCFSSRPYDLRDELGVKGGTLGFFTEDWRFEKAFSNFPAFHAEWVDGFDWTCLVQPDYSTYEDYPFPLRLYNLYKSRWVARYWQSLGLYVIPALQSVFLPSSQEILGFIDPESDLSEIDDSVFDVGLLTLPNPCPVVAVQCRTIKHHGGDFREFAKWLTHRIEYLNPEVVIIYGGGDHQSKFLGYLPEENSNLKYVLLQSYSQERRGWMKRQEKIRKKAQSAQ